MAGLSRHDGFPSGDLVRTVAHDDDLIVVFADQHFLANMVATVELNHWHNFVHLAANAKSRGGLRGRRAGGVARVLVPAVRSAGGAVRARIPLVAEVLARPPDTARSSSRPAADWPQSAPGSASDTYRVASLAGEAPACRMSSRMQAASTGSSGFSAEASVTPQ
jgi:hypothetical protein